MHALLIYMYLHGIDETTRMLEEKYCTLLILNTVLMHAPHQKHFDVVSSTISKLCRCNRLSLKTVLLHPLHQEVCVVSVSST